MSEAQPQRATCPSTRDASGGDPRGHGLAITRRTLFRSNLGHIEAYESAGAPAGFTLKGYSPEIQVALPYTGLFLWRVGRTPVVIDACQVLYVAGDEEFQIDEPVPGGYGELIVTPAAELWSDVAASDTAPQRDALFCRRRAPATPEVLLSRGRVCGRGTCPDGLSGDEALVGLLRAALRCPPSPDAVHGPTRRLVDRAKQYIAAVFRTSVSLSDVARAVGASPAYLTDVFRRSEGVSLHRYVVRMRLARALVDLPATSDITTLALQLGFSSHSHFTAAFRKAYGCTPSQFRNSTSRVQGALRRRVVRAASRR